MSVHASQVIIVLFSTPDGTDASVGPTGQLYLNGATNAASVAIAHLATGLYKATVTLPNNVDMDHAVAITAAMTVSGAAIKPVIFQAIATLVDNNGYPYVDVAGVAGDNDAPDGLKNFGLAALQSSPASSATASTVVTLLTTENQFPDGFFPPGSMVLVSEGTGFGQWRVITEFRGDGTFAITPDWAVTPDETSRIAVLPAGLIVGLDDLLDAVATGTVSIISSSPVAQDLSLAIFRGDDYYYSDNRGLKWATTAAETWPDLTAATIVFTANKVTANDNDGDATLTAAGTVRLATGAAKMVSVDLPSAATAGLALGTHGYKYDVQATLSNGHVVTLASGTLSVREDQTT